MLFLSRDNKFSHRFLSLTEIYYKINSFLFLKVYRGDPTSPKRREAYKQEKKNPTFVFCPSPLFNIQQNLLIFKKHPCTLVRKENTHDVTRGSRLFNVETLKRQSVQVPQLCKCPMREGISHMHFRQPSLKRSRHWNPHSFLPNSSPITTSEHVFKGLEIAQDSV